MLKFSFHCILCSIFFFSGTFVNNDSTSKDAKVYTKVYARLRCWITEKYSDIYFKNCLVSWDHILIQTRCWFSVFVLFYYIKGINFHDFREFLPKSRNLILAKIMKISKFAKFAKIKFFSSKNRGFLNFFVHSRISQTRVRA